MTIIDVKTFWRLFFAVLMARKENCMQNLLIFQGNSYSCRTRIIVSSCCWNTCKLLFTETHTWVTGLVSVWTRH